MTKTKSFTHNGRSLSVKSDSGAHDTWIVSVLDEQGLTVSTTGSLPRWSAPDPARAPAGAPTTIEALMDKVIADVSSGHLPLLPST